MVEFIENLPMYFIFGVTGSAIVAVVGFTLVGLIKFRRTLGIVTAGSIGVVGLGYCIARLLGV
jgi:putative flippase GtrA